MQPALPAPETESLVEREYNAEITEQMGGEYTLYNPDNPATWIQTDTIVDIQQ